MTTRDDVIEVLEKVEWVYEGEYMDNHFCPVCGGWKNPICNTCKETIGHEGNCKLSQLLTTLRQKNQEVPNGKKTFNWMDD